MLKYEINKYNNFHHLQDASLTLHALLPNSLAAAVEILKRQAPISKL